MKRLLVSYAHKDQAIMQETVAELHSLGLEVWIDTREIVLNPTGTLRSPP